jgi:hypothetical protein
MLGSRVRLLESRQADGVRLGGREYQTNPNPAETKALALRACFDFPVHNLHQAAPLRRQPLPRPPLRPGRGLGAGIPRVAWTIEHQAPGSAGSRRGRLRPRGRSASVA